MVSLLETEVQDQLKRYLRGEIPLNAFRGWLMPATWALQPGASPLVEEVLLRLAEFSNGDWTEEELRRELALLLERDRSSGTEDAAIIQPSVVRIVPFGSIQMIISSIPQEDEEQDLEPLWRPDELIRDTAVTHAVPVPASSFEPL